ncbi:uncharacterized protein LOC112041353, partial [Lingula anatina]|uniref:Uncharacterized protein LOC112041353 n=1 Tax=Lingula anatina TaxID=7574 RepID=A0A2R2MJE1_LINAN
MYLAVLAEFSLPLSMMPILIELSKASNQDRKALDRLSMDRTSASYKMKYGLAEWFHEQTVSELKTEFFSLNIDESTSSNLQRVLSILVSYYSPSRKRVVVQHLHSTSVIKVDSLSIFNHIVDVFDRNEIPWQNLVSVLLDSCNVMRGSKSGVESRLRAEKARHLLDVDGDSCHHIHNATHKFCKPFDYWIEQLLHDLYNDMKWSTDIREWFTEICLLLGLKFTMPERFVNHRWLSCFDVSSGTQRLFDAYTVFYYSFIPKDEKPLYTSVVASILSHRNINPEAKTRIRELQTEISNKVKTLTADGKKRKERLVERLFYNRRKTRLILSFYIAVLPMLKSYVCLFELKEPMIHLLHNQQEELFRNFLSCFVKPEVLQNLTAKKMKELSISDEVLLDEKDMFFGKTATSLMEMHRKDSGVVQFKHQAKQAYVSCAVYMQKKLPLDSTLLRCLSALNPKVRGGTTTLKRLKKLPILLPNVLNDEQAEEFGREIHNYNVSGSLPPFNEDGKPLRLDVWFSKLFEDNSYPALYKIVRAILSIFHGPQVESSFNVMGDIIDSRSGRMNIETYNSIQIVKYGLSSRKESESSVSVALDQFRRKDVVYDPVDVRLCHKIRGSSGKYRKILEEQRQKLAEKQASLNISANKLQSKLAAKRAQHAAEKKARLEHQLRQEKAQRKATIGARLKKLVALKKKKK